VPSEPAQTTLRSRPLWWLPPGETVTLKRRGTLCSQSDELTRRARDWLAPASRHRDLPCCRPGEERSGVQMPRPAPRAWGTTGGFQSRDGPILSRSAHRGREKSEKLDDGQITELRARHAGPLGERGRQVAAPCIAEDWLVILRKHAKMFCLWRKTCGCCCSWLAAPSAHTSVWAWAATSRTWGSGTTSHPRPRLLLNDRYRRVWVERFSDSMTNDDN